MDSKYSLPQDGGLILEGTPKDIIHRYEKIPTSIFEIESQGVEYVAQQIVEAIHTHNEKNLSRHFKLGLTTGRTPYGIYQELVKRYEAGEVSFSNVEVYSLDEFYPIKDTELQSRNYHIKKNLLDKVDIKPENVNLIDGTKPIGEVSAYCAEYERKARNLDLIIIGMGEQGQVGFNEAGSYAKSVTRLVQLSHQSRKAQANSFYGIENSYFLNLAYVDAQNAYVIDRDYLEDSKMDFKTSTAPSAFLHLHPTKDLGGSFATVEALLADETHGKNVRGFGGYWKVEDGKLYFGDVRVATAAERVMDETEYKTDEENKVVFENEAFTAGSEWTLYIGDVASSVTVTEAGKVEVEIDPATINGYRTVVRLQSEEMILSYVNVIAVTYIHNAAELRALGVGTSAISSVEGNDKKGYYMLADDIDCAEENAFAAGYSYQKSYFKGVFDGNSKTISNITVNEGGIFGGMSGAVVKNVNFTGVKYNAKLGNYAGNWSNYTALLGQLANNGTVIENINVQVAATDFQYGVENMNEALLFA